MDHVGDLFELEQLCGRISNRLRFTEAWPSGVRGALARTLERRGMLAGDMKDTG